MSSSPSSATLPSIQEWKAMVAPFTVPSTARATWQVVNTLVPFFAAWYAAYWSLSVSYWLTLAFCTLAALLVVRTFIIFHDCCHGSFYGSKTANNIVGFFTGLITITPFFHWRWEHNQHHATCGDLERRGVGDVWTMTVKEYKEAPVWKKFVYRVTRNPFVLFVIAPTLLFVVYQRFAKTNASRRERMSVWTMNLAIAAVVALMSWAIGWKSFLLVQLPVTAIAGAVGVWMFYVQHQFEDVYWEHHQEWDYTSAALRGSSFYRLPKILQWFSGNIGFHHIHHLSPRIPNYRLEQCHNSRPAFQQAPTLTLWESLKTMHLRLWDEETRRLVGWEVLRRPSAQAS